MGSIGLWKLTKNSWTPSQRYALPVTILALFLALAALTVIRLSESMEKDHRERYVADCQALGKHLATHDLFRTAEVAQVQGEIDSHCSHNKAVIQLEYLHVQNNGHIAILAGNRPERLEREARLIERTVIESGRASVNWKDSDKGTLLEIIIPVRNRHQEILGCLSYTVHGAFDDSDVEFLCYAAGFCLLLAVMVLYYFGQIRRVTRYHSERQQAEEKLRRLSAAVAQSANMIAITDVSGEIEYVNPQFCRLTGYSSEEAVGQQPNLLKSGEHSQEFYAELWKTIAGKQTWTGQVRNRRKNGELFWERKTISPVIDDRGEIQNYLSVGEDITSELRAQQQIIEKDKMSAIGVLAAGVAHEFKNYLGGIMGNASLALEDIDKPNGPTIARETLELVIDLSEKANMVAMSLLTYSRSRPEAVGSEDIRKIVEQSLNLVSKEMTSRAIQVSTYFEKVPKLRVSSSKIQQLLLNLLMNAAHAVKEDGVITIALFNAGDSVKIVVGDSGSGIAPDKVSRIFDPFYSSKGVWGKDDVVGTGMGLAICRNFAREYKGDLTVESIPGIGTAFTVVLPVEEEADRMISEHARTNQHLRLLIFTLDKTIVSRLHAEASAAGIKLMMVDNIASVPRDLQGAADLVVCDARFPAKGELLHVVDACDTSGIPFATVYSEQLEYQIADMREQSIKCFTNLPTIRDLVADLETFAGGEANPDNRQSVSPDSLSTPTQS